MRGQNINIYLPYETFVKIESLIKERKISSFVNQAILREIQEQEQRKKESFEKSMINAYKRVANNQEIQAEAKVWEEVDSDGLDENKWEF
ncbi:MAG: RNA 2'-phosphotransferase [Mycoplasmataceae bacterium]|nr:MAG: RNA 2'-phosphotransferase [Mycoplasmataceae bacterium]